MAADNMLLGQFRLEGLPPAPRGMPQVEVTFDIDANGILNVTAKDKATGKEQRISITASTNLNKQDVERMVQEAQRNSADDARRKQLAEARNVGDQVVYQAEKSLKDLGERVSGADRGAVEGKMNDLRDALKTDDASRIQRATEALKQATMSLGGAAYGASGSTGGATQPGAQPDEGVVDGEYRNV